MYIYYAHKLSQLKIFSVTQYCNSSRSPNIPTLNVINNNKGPIIIIIFIIIHK